MLEQLLRRNLDPAAGIRVTPNLTAHKHFMQARPAPARPPGPAAGAMRGRCWRAPAAACCRGPPPAPCLPALPLPACDCPVSSISYSPGPGSRLGSAGLRVSHRVELG